MANCKGESALVLDEHSENSAEDRSTDADGWIIPRPRRLSPQKQPPAEAENHRRLVGKLQRAGWHVAEQATCYTRDGEIRIPDILIWHKDLKSVGAVEVKSEIRTTKQAFAALKQCYDYTQCKVLATGHRVEWGAIYPFDPAPHGEIMGGEMWGAASFTSMHLKVCVFIDEPAFKRWEAVMRRGPETVRVFSPERVRLQYKDQHRVWCSDLGFVANAIPMLTGKRQVGGSRKDA